MGYYKSFEHVVNYDHVDVEGYFRGTCYITPKLDGTNAVIWYDSEKEKLCAGSRNRELSLEKDNASFCEWIENTSHEEVNRIYNFLKDFPHIIIYGEFACGKIGNIKDYNDNAKNFLWIFDMYDTEAEHYLHYNTILEYAVEYYFDKWVVPILDTIENPTVEEIEEIAESNFFLLDNANHPGEGVVIRNYDYRDRFGHYKIAKYVRDEYRQNKKHKKVTLKPGDIEENIVSRYVTDAELAKAKEKTAAYFNEPFKVEKKMMGYYLNLVMRESVLDECADWVKKFNSPTINFKLLQALVTDKARSYLGL